MGHLPSLITDLALILITAAFVTIVFKKIKQPLVLGYVIAGFLVGPFSTVFPSIADAENVETLAEIGVIFLLFSLGLEFSFKKLMRVGGYASITAIIEIVFISVAGFITGKLLGWPTMDCLFLGGMLASSSTTIILRAFDELGVKSKPYARIVFGILVVEDIVVILLMVLLSTIAVTKSVEGGEMLLTILKLSFFLVLWFVSGIFIIPTLLKKVKTLLTDEVYLILSTGLCLGMVFIATKAGFSAELGAFIMGSILAETTSAEKIEHIFEPVKNLFGAVFFVSVGMMINPATLLQYGWIVLAVTGLTIVGKYVSTTAGAIISGQPLRQSVQAGMSMAQIGEFAFIVATLGMSLGVISDFLFPVAVAASAITTFTTPYMIKYSGNFYTFIERVMPENLLLRIEKYSATMRTMQAESEWKKLVKQYITNVFINGFIVLAFIILGTKVLFPILIKIIPTDFWSALSTIVIVLVVSSPFLWALMFKKPDYITTNELWSNKEYNHGPLFMMEILRVLTGIVLIGYLLDMEFSTFVSFLVVIPIVIMAIFLFSKNIQNVYRNIENRFMVNLNSREMAEKEKFSPLQVHAQSSELSTWDAYLTDLQVPPNAEYTGKTFQELSWREKYGINVVYIKRGDKIIYSPGPKSRVLPLDHLGVFTSETQLEAFKPVLDKEYKIDHPYINEDDIIVERIVVDAHNYLNGIAIRDSGIRERTQAIVVGIERGGEKILSPSSTTVFREHDIVWLVGEKKKLKMLKN
ncbi:MAG: cation:proton antiporter [Tannerella sp.]|jgi:CPA2 family monovalent cation:H+ antiporter-2|nr:cation:proton antiporter [Tannerella sp.]